MFALEENTSCCTGTERFDYEELHEDINVHYCFSIRAISLMEKLNNALSHKELMTL